MCIKSNNSSLLLILWNVLMTWNASPPTGTKKSVETFVYRSEALDSPASNKQYSTPVWKALRTSAIAIQVMNVMPIPDA